MFQPRSQSRGKHKRTSKRRRRTAWRWINVSMLLLITVMLTYLFGHLGDGGDPSSAPLSQLPVAEQSPAPSPEVSEVAASASPSATTEAISIPSPSADNETDASAEETPVPVVSASPAPATAPAASASPDPGSEPAGSAAPDSGTSAVAGLPPEAKNGKTVKLNFAGDIIFSGKAGDLLMQKGYDYSYAALDGLFKQDDLSVVNLETPVTTRGVGAPNKQFVFKGPPEALDALKAAGVDAVNLANNHTLDQGEEGLRDTLTHLSKRNIPYVGAGLDSKEAYSAQYFERNGIRVALLGFTRVMPLIEWKAEENQPGLASVYDSAEGLKAIAEARKQADLVVVMVHWGRERMDQYDSIQQGLGHSFIDAGADLVIGGHPHVLQGIEPYKGKWIAYSTGNFIFTRGSVAATWETAVFQAECSAQGQCSMKLLPMTAELAQPIPMNDPAGQLLLKRVESISGGRVKINNDGMVSQVTR
ncbi:CapA family protein [Paenibacillus donghaensis]|uniref:Capsule synthesis protein CapA domain-containing protein n=1 Tax=Paenibacillus donghaensis TaxID=414771 RepID=A0A2Z2K4D3_9BACL|nr:CapA family protein [Paenibacillus donghaensis]ASA20636.1 hypothetical protein B9T62_07410 [Paenibacillus donghaensis]